MVTGTLTFRCVPAPMYNIPPAPVNVGDVCASILSNTNQPGCAATTVSSTMLLLTITWLGATTIIGVPSATTVLVAVGCSGVGVVVVTVLVGCPVDVGVGVTVVPVAVGVLVPVGVAVPLMGVPLVAVAVLVLVGDVPLPTLVAVGVGVALIVGVSVVMLAALVGNVAVGVALYVSLVLVVGVVVAVFSDAGYASMIVGVSVDTPPPWPCGGTTAVGVCSPANGSTVLVGV